jgi:tRNA modification GTPase
VTETVDLEGLRVTLVDTAGLRESTDPVEIEGVARSRQAQQVADLILVVIDGSRPVEDEDIELVNQTIEYKRLLVFNKADVTAPDSRPSLDGLTVSARTGEGLNGLVRAMLTSLDIEHLEDRPAITNVRHIALVERADKALARAQVAVGSAERTSMPEEFVLADLQEARATLEEITGHQTTDDLLRHIFARFCVGK